MACRWIVTIAMFISSTAGAEPPPPPIDDAIKAAVSDGKPLIVEMYTTWCGPCKKFESDTLSDSSVKAGLLAVTFVRYDAEQAPGDAVAARFHVNGYPTLLAIDSKGVEVARTSGALNPTEFLGWLRTAQASMLTEAQILANVLAKPSVATRLAAANWYERHKRIDQAVLQYKWIAKSRGATTEQKADALRVAAKLGRVAGWRSELVAEKVAAIRAAPQEATIDDLALVTVESDLANATVREICGAFLAARTFRTNLNNAIYVALAAGATDEALAAAKRMVGERRSPMFLDTLAECHHVRGERTEALATSDEALALLTPSSPLLQPYTANRTRFDKGSGDSRESVAIRTQVGHFWEHFAEIGKLNLDRALEAGSQRNEMKLWRARYEAKQKLERAVAYNCLDGTAVTTRVHAYVEIDGADRVTLKSLLTEKSLPASIKRCIHHELAVGTLPHEEGEVMLDLQGSTTKK